MNNPPSIRHYNNADAHFCKERNVWVLIADYRQVIDTHISHLSGEHGVLIMSFENWQFPPLSLEARTAIPTDAAAHHLNRKPQTLRAWASLENGPIRPIRINGRLAWPVAAIRALLSGDAA